MSLVKIFSGSEILALALRDQILEAGLVPVVKNNIQSGRLAGFGTYDQAVEIFIEEAEYGKVSKIIDDFRINNQ